MNRYDQLIQVEKRIRTVPGALVIAIGIKGRVVPKGKDTFMNRRSKEFLVSLSTSQSSRDHQVIHTGNCQDNIIFIQY